MNKFLDIILVAIAGHPQISLYGQLFIHNHGYSMGQLTKIDRFQDDLTSAGNDMCVWKIETKPDL